MTKTKIPAARLTTAQLLAIDIAIEVLAAQGLTPADLLAEVVVRDLISWVHDFNADLRMGDDEKMTLEGAYECFAEQSEAFPAIAETEAKLEERFFGDVSDVQNNSCGE